MHFTLKNQVKNGQLLNIEHRETVPGRGIVKIKRREQKTAYSTHTVTQQQLLNHG